MWVKPGDKIVFDSNSNLGLREDVVRELFMQRTHADDELGAPAVVLTEHSWCYISSIVSVNGKWGQPHPTIDQYAELVGYE